MHIPRQLYAPSTLPPRKNLRKQSRLKRLGEQKNHIPLPEFEPEAVQPLAQPLCRLIHRSSRVREIPDPNFGPDTNNRAFSLTFRLIPQTCAGTTG